MDASANIVYLHSHDTGRYVQPYGQQVPDAEHPAARRPGTAVPPGVLRGADVLGQPRVPADRPVGARQRDDRARPPRAGSSPTTAATSCTRCAQAGYWSALIGEQHLSPTRTSLGYDHVVDIGTTRVALDRAGGAAAAAQPAAAAVLPVDRVLRDPPRVLRAQLGARRAVRRAAGAPARHAPRRAPTWPRSRPAPARSTRASARSCTALDEAGPGRRHTRRAHHRPRAAVPGREGARSPTAGSA